MPDEDMPSSRAACRTLSAAAPRSAGWGGGAPLISPRERLPPRRGELGASPRLDLLDDGLTSPLPRGPTRHGHAPTVVQFGAVRAYASSACILAHLRVQCSRTRAALTGRSHGTARDRGGRDDRERAGGAAGRGGPRGRGGLAARRPPR